MPIKVKIQGNYAMTPWGYLPSFLGQKEICDFLRFCGANLRFATQKNATKMEALLVSVGDYCLDQEGIFC